ncbi:uncharacterized protein [Haliotis cracherodii]|uniref:uncharacterized protein isoform X1 n=1 Tax=Haliotis cracherodii TaxID=6455 RepID=UPI0039ED46B9
MASNPRGNLREHVQKQLRSSSSVGKGTLGKVYKVRGFDDEQYALKVSGFIDATTKEEKYLLGEVETLSRFQHPHIVRHIDGWDTRDKQGQLRVYILMEYCPGGDLRSYLNNTLGRPPPEAEFGTWLAQIASGLDFIHSMGVLHRNVKTPNIMVGHVDGHVTLKIGDFGMSKMLLQPDAMAKSQVGTPYFMSPEILNGRQYNMKTDIWSLGCTAYEMATLTTLFQAQTITTLLSGINKHKAAQVTKQIKYRKFFQMLIGEMLHQDPKARPDAGEILTRLLDKGYKTTHLGMTASSTLTSTTSSTGSRTRISQGQGQTDSKVAVWSMMDSDTSGVVSDAGSMVIREDVSNPHWCDIDKNDKVRLMGMAVVPPVIPRSESRPRTKSESDMDLGLQAFTEIQRKKKLSKSVTFDQRVSTSVIPEVAGEDAEEKVEGKVEELLSSGDKGRILCQIGKEQSSLAQTGEAVFTAAFSKLNIRSDAKMENDKVRSMGMAIVPPVIPRSDRRPRTKSEGCESDMDLGLQEFSEIQRKKKLPKSVTFYRRVSTSVLPDKEVAGEDAEEEEEREVEELLSSGDKGRILCQIGKEQSSLAQTMGEAVFTAAFSKLNIRTDAKMERELASVLGDQYEEFGPRFVLLRALERAFADPQEDGSQMKRKSLNKTI